MANNQEEPTRVSVVSTPVQSTKTSVELSVETPETDSSNHNLLFSPTTVTCNLACKALHHDLGKLKLCDTKKQTKKTPLVDYDEMYTTINTFSKTIFGNMRLAVHKKTKKMRAVKVFNKVLLRRRRAIGGKSVRESFDMELMLMKWLRQYPNPGCLAASPEHEQVEDLRHKYIVMPFASDGDLLAFIDKNGGKIADKVVRDIFLQLISALQHLHEKAGYIHGDVSPENILISFDATGRLRVQLCDYGLACKIGSFHHKCGKRGYIAPENYSTKGRKAEPQSDVFALAIVMFILYYGKPPFQTATESDVYYDGLGKRCQYRASAYSCWLRAWGYSKKRSEWGLLPTILSMLKRDPKQRPTLASIKTIVEGWKRWY